MQINVTVQDANNILCEVTPPQPQIIVIDRGVEGNGIVSIVPVTISTFQYLRITYTNGTVQDVGPLTSTAYTATAPITIVGNTISLATVPIASGGTDATTAAGAIQNLLPSYTGNGNKRLGLNSLGTALEWVLDGGGTVTSVAASGGTTGLTFTGSPITTSGTLTLGGTLTVANGGTGVTTSTGTGSVVLSTSPTLVTPVLGTPTSGNFSSGTFTWPTFNQNTTGTAANITATSNSTLTTLSALSLPGSQVSGNITGNAGNVTGIVAIANGGTGQITANAAFNALAPSQTGNSGKYLTTDGSNTSWATNPLGTVTSVSGTGTVNGLTLTGTVTTSGSLTLGGTLSGIANSALTNSSITIGGTTISLGGSSNALANDITIYGVTVGRGAGAVSTNTAVGASAVASNVSGTQITAVGYQAAKSTTGANVAAFGSNSGASNTTGTLNAFFGTNSGYGNTTGSGNTALGEQALFYATTPSNNTAVGYVSAYLTTTGTNLVAVGMQALYSNTTGAQNTALGRDALYSNTTASNNTAVGYQALYNNTGGSNTAIGYQAGLNNTTGTYNSFIGRSTGYASTGTANTFVGFAAGYSNTTGSGNTFVGATTGGGGSGDLITTGSKNTIIGGYNGNQGGLDIRTASNNIVLSDGDGNVRVWCNNEGRVIFGELTNLGSGYVNMTYNSAANSALVIRTSSTTYSSAAIVFQSSSANNAGYIQISGSNSVIYSTSSDYRLKNVIGSVSGSGARIDALEPIEYEWKETGERTRGFLAHKFQEVYPQSVTGTKDAVDSQGTPIYQGMQAGSSEVIADLVAEIKSLRKRLADAGL